MDKKNCNKCKIEQPFINFYKDTRAKDKLRSTCKSCVIKRNNEREEENIKVRLTIDESTTITNKLCNICNNIKNISEFEKGMVNIQDFCKQCFINKKTALVSEVFKKTCTSCKIEKDNIYFNKHIKGKDGYCEKCYKCMNIVRHATEENKKRDERFLKDQVKQCSTCKEEKAFTEFTQDVNCKFGLKSKCKPCSQTIKREYSNNKKKTSPIFKLECNLRGRIRNAMVQKRNGGAVKSAKTIELLGASIETVYKHLEVQFKDGMTWENYGKWHVDHILPCSSFDLGKPDEQLKCFNYKNLQPLWAIDNLKKHAKII
jgi:hypothetical protein